ncbi:MAG: DEAD/DEAH box helicase [Pirellulales bacterium]|nr:DEAD/DEAH box helicase [Pirellulales bacterium]
MKFTELDLSPALLKAVASQGYEVATPIQAQAIPPILAGRDLVGCAQTGTGKTAAFALPTLQRILASVQTQQGRDSFATTDIPLPPAPPVAKASRPLPRTHRGRESFATSDPQSPSDSPVAKASRPLPRSAERTRDARRRTRALVLAPTRELASQIAASFAAYGKHTPSRHAVVYGGVSQFHQVKALQHGVDALIATPGRLLDLMQQGHVELRHVEVLILDEADQMLDMGFLPDLRRIIARVPRQRQTLMFSATMPEAIRKLADEWLQSPVSVSVVPVGTPAAKVDQRVYFVEKAVKAARLQAYLQATPSTRTLVFARTKHGADKIVRHLSRNKIRAAAIHGNKSQSARERTLEQFKSSRPPVLVATDIAARGLDIKDISHVVNYDLPETPETYVHRIGRTARAGADGAAVSFCSAEEVKHLRGIERLTRQRIAIGEGHEQHTTRPPQHAEPTPQRQQRRSTSPKRRQGTALASPASPPRQTGSAQSTQRKPRRRIKRAL